MSLTTIVIWYAVLLACMGAILWAYMNVRAHRIVSRLGAFRCWSCPDVYSGWMAGIGVYGVEELSWYRPVGLSFKPVYPIPCRGMEVPTPIAHLVDGPTVGMRLAYGDYRYEAVVEHLTYYELVSWVESGPPRLV